ncbi:hypothetical protein N665_2708s0002 [Sinapis alba]|nr:hypothetical protein N665_2708s0002 [Sinapis alba]
MSESTVRFEQIGNRSNAFLKYLLLKTRENKVFGFSTSLQKCFPSIVVLKSKRSLNPNDPSSLGLHNLSQDFQCIPLEFPPELHQNCATALISFLLLF